MDNYTIQVGNKLIRVDRKTGRHEVIKTLPLKPGKWYNSGSGWHFIKETK